MQRAELSPSMIYLFHIQTTPKILHLCILFFLITLDLSSFKKHLSEMLFFRYFPPKNSSIEQLFNDFLKKTSEKIAIPYKHFLKKDKSINYYTVPNIGNLIKTL